jgi:hypothetical protein
MASLILERILETQYRFSLDGGDWIWDERPTITAFGSICHFKTMKGANIIRRQNILFSEVTIRDTYSSTADYIAPNIISFFERLIIIQYIREDGIGGGASLFTSLSDTFTFFGNDGKVPVVDEAQLKLVPRTFYNFSELTQLNDVEISSLIEGKILGVSSIAGQFKVTLVDKPTDGTTYFSAVGGFDYNDLATQTTPLAYTSGNLQLTNDALGTYTFLSQPPYGITSLWDEDTNTLDLSQLSIGDEVFLRVHINVTTTASNQISGLKILFGEGTANEYTQPIDLGISFKTAGSYDVLRELKFYIGNNDWKNTPAKILFTSDSNASVVVNGWHPYIIRKSINVLDVQVKGGSDKQPYELATDSQTVILVDASADNVDIWINQVMQTEGLQYNRVAGNVTMTYPLSEGDTIVKRAYTSESVKEVFTAIDLQTEVVLSNSPRNIDVWVNGVYQIEIIHYTLSENIVTFTYSLNDADYINVRKNR